MTNVLPSAANADHFTAVLRSAGVLGDARVRAVDPENPRDTILSHIVRLKLAYDVDAPGAPASLILKTARHDRLDPSWVGGRQEVAFYNQVAPRLPAGLVPRCFDADWSADTNEWHLLLEDLSATHMIATTWPLPPSSEQCEIIIGSLARVHADWWDNPGLGAAVGTWLDDDALDQGLRTFAGHLARFIDQYGDRLAVERRQLYDRLIEGAPRLRQR